MKMITMFCETPGVLCEAPDGSELSCSGQFVELGGNSIGVPVNECKLIEWTAHSGEVSYRLRCGQSDYPVTDSDALTLIAEGTIIENDGAQELWFLNC